MRHPRSFPRSDTVTLALGAVDSGWGGHVWVGEPGAGKSRLLERTLEHVHSRDDCTVVRLTAGGLAPEVRRLQTLAGMPTDVATNAETLAADIARAISTTTTTVFAADRLDRLDDSERRALLSLASTRAARVVLLATSRSHSPGWRVPHPLAASAVHPLDASETLRLLHEEEGFAIAPHVAATLAQQLAGNVGAILETAAVLDPDQLAGTRALPDPLPVTPATDELFGIVVDALDESERTALLVASVAVWRRTDALLLATGFDLVSLISSRVAEHLHFVAGRFALVDPRIRSIVHGRATIIERTRAHERLASAHRELGDANIEAWHTSLAALAGLPSVAPALIDLATDALHRGDSIWAHDVAREAASQAGDDDRVAAEVVAGMAALHSGFVSDAVQWLGRVQRSGNAGLSARSLAAYTIAVTLAQGHIPEAELDAANDRVSRGDVLPVVTANAVGAALFSERGDATSARRLLATAGRLASGVEGAEHIIELAWSWCGLFGAAPATVHSIPTASPAVSNLQPYLAVCTGLALLADGDTSAATSFLSSAALGLSRDDPRETSPVIAATPLLEAHLAVAQSLADVAAGKYSAAAGRLDDAAFSSPVALVFAGLGVSTARRLCVVRGGALSGVASALESVFPTAPTVSMRRQAHLDNALTAAFASKPSEAAMFFAMAEASMSNDLERVLPSIDEVGMLLDADQPMAARKAARRGDVAGSTSLALRNSLALEPGLHAHDDWAAAIAASRGIRSPFERALTELALGTAMAEVGDEVRARTHLLASLEFFSTSGATELSTWARSRAAADVPPQAGGMPRQEWADGLTDREFEVASLVVLGTTNREAADRLHLSVRTVEVHLARVFAKLDVRSRTELSYRAHRRTADHVRSST